MLITRTNRPLKANTAKATTNSGSTESKTGKEKIADIVTTGAFATGGMLGGATIGGVGGHLLSSVTGQPGLSTIGTAAGALMGTATGISASRADNKKAALTKAALSYGLGTAGAAAGIYGFEAAHTALVAAGATPLLGASLRLTGAIAGGMVGVGASQLGEDGKIQKTLKEAGLAAALGTLGTGIGMGMTILAPNSLAPYAFGASGAIIGQAFASEAHALGEDDASVQRASAAFKGALGFAVGEALGAAAQSLGGSSVYGLAAPATLGAVGGLSHLGRTNQTAETLNHMVAGTGAGAVVGDLAGLGLTALTGNSAYASFGAGAGAVTGLVGTTPKLNKAAFAVVASTVGGTGAGALAGALLTTVTGNEIFNAALPALGATAGLLTGAAIKLNS